MHAPQHEPYPEAITLDTLPALLAHHRDRYAGFVMEADEEEEEEEVEDPGDKGDDAPDDEPDDDAEEGDDEPLGDAGKKALKAERDKVKELRRKLREATAAGRKEDDGDGDDAEEKAAAKWKPKVVNAAARAAFLEAGADRPERLLKLLDHDELDISDDGDVEGLDDEVDRLREEYPELFAKPRRSGRRVETGDRSGKGPAKKLSATERQARLLAGKN